MISATEFKITSSVFSYKRDEFPLVKIQGARVKLNTISDHLLKIVLVGVLFSSVVWMIYPEEFGVLLAPIAFVVGVVYTIFNIKKYELQVEFEHIDETGVQWVSVVGSSHPQSKPVFEIQVDALKHAISK
ncbi:hypothetical protein MD535_03500 [Vibrio sp. ZSDZ65]|uniref:Uncharacterized protein n=1 Tax=Vibrio qingdaonensis TaxID=2829491 RepID=A0A9X3CKG7_9VIBR|nr:hypothetical protein [Vibrio qingdaonensis]MCW8345093.1 hypothetical protein [Vibrio qingdaonensis]